MSVWVDEVPAWFYSVSHILQVGLNEYGIFATLGNDYLANRPCKILLKKLV